MRTNIDIDDELMADAMKWSGKATKKAAVEEALRYYAKAKAFRDLVEGMRGIEWDDGLSQTHNEFAEEPALPLKP